MARILPALLLLFSAPVFAGAPYAYVVQPGDTLGKIVQKLNPEHRIWGKKGGAVLIYTENHKTLTDQDKIYPGQKLIIPFSVTYVDQPARALASEPMPAERGEDKEQTPASSALTEAERPATISLGMGSSLWSRSLKDKTTGSTGTAKSKPTLELAITGQFPVSEKWDVDTGAKYRQISFAGSSNRGIQAETKNFMSFHLGAQREEERYSYSFGLEYGQIPLITGVNSTTVGITAFSAASPYFAAAMKMHQYGKTRIDFSGQVRYELPNSVDSYKFEHGWLTELALPISRNVGENLFTLSPSASYGMRETNTVKHADFTAGMTLIWHWQLR
jgi:hypothetical protein